MRPTGRGWAVLAAVAVLAGGGVALGWAAFVGLAVAGSLLVIVAISMVSGGRLRGVDAPASLRIERGSSGSVSFSIIGDGLSGRSAVRLRNGREIVRCTRGARGSLVATIDVDTHRRGVVDVGPWALERIDPWALVVRRLGRIDAVELLVVPRVHHLHPDTVPMLISERGRTRQGTSSLATLREYVIGDELRQVHWRSTAKTGRLMVRQYVDVTKPVLVLVVDMNPTSYASIDELDDTVDLAASIAAAAVGVAVEIRTTTGDRADFNGGNRLPMLEMLARATMGVGSIRPTHGTVVEVGPRLLAQRRAEQR